MRRVRAARGREREREIPSSLITRNHRTHGKREREREREGTREKERDKERERHTRTQPQTPRVGLTLLPSHPSSFAHGSWWATRRASFFRCVSVCIKRMHSQCAQLHTLTHLILKCVSVCIQKICECIYLCALCINLFIANLFIKHIYSRIEKQII
jgi:hypothetical protein